MNQVVIFLVPAGATQRHFEAAMRDRFESLDIGEVRPAVKAAETKLSEADKLPMWTWFIPNPRP